jgi:membrane-associated protease RseP (regulator of RpoE activity)
MKTIALITATCLACVHGAFAEEKTETKSSSSVSFTTNATDGKGKGVLVIDVDGKKETREIELSQPVNTARLTLTKAVSTGPQTFLGLSPTSLADAVADQLPIAKGTGLLVATVLADSPAAQAGLQKNDVILRFDDQILTNPEQLVTLVRIKKPGDEVKITYLRKGQEATATAKLVSKEWRPAEKAALTIDTNGNILKLGDLVAGLTNNGSPLTFEKKIMIVEPDGKVVISDAMKTLESVAAELENTIKNKVAPEILAAVKKAIDQAKQAVEDGAKKAEEAGQKK